MDLKLKKLLEAQPQVANSLSSASQKAATDIPEQKVSLADSAAALVLHPRELPFHVPRAIRGHMELFLNSDFAKRNIAKRILEWFSV